MYLAAAAGAFVFFEILRFVHPAGMGDGDGNLALLMGAVLGASIVPALFVAFALGCRSSASPSSRASARVPARWPCPSAPSWRPARWSPCGSVPR